MSAAELGLIGAPRFYGTPYPDTPPAPEFSLVSHEGERIGISDFQGRAVFLFFGFSRCPDVCPLTLSKLARILGDMGVDADRAAILMVTVDGEHDTPEVLADFVPAFGPLVTGLTGTAEELRAVYSAYGVFAHETDGANGAPTIAHTSQVFGIDADGRLRVLIHADDFAERVESDIRALLRA